MLLFCQDRDAILRQAWRQSPTGTRVHLHSFLLSHTDMAVKLYQPIQTWNIHIQSKMQEGSTVTKAALPPSGAG